MPNPISGVACGDSYTDAATIGPLTMGSNGGYFIISGQDVFMQLGYKEQGRGVSDIRWMDEAHVPIGNGVFYKGTFAARFRNFVTGNIATVSGGLATPTQPLFTIAAGGVASSTSTSMITGIVSAAGAVTGGSGFTVAKGTSGIYTVTFNTALGTVPVVVATVTENNSGLGITVNTVTTGGFGVRTDTTATPTNHSFNFLAVPSS